LLNIPSPPTDNLYKFLALAGILIVVGGYVFVYLQADRSQELLRELKQGAALIHAETEIARLRSLLNDPNERRGKHLEEGYEAAARERARLTKVEEELKFLLAWKNRSMILLAAAHVVGSVLSAVGFALWYQRVQRYQDLILRRQATDTKETETGS